MKKFTLLHKSNLNGTKILGVKSRITPSLPLLSLLLMLIFGGWSSEAWGSNPIYNNGNWYSVCDGTAYEKSTASVTGVTLQTYSNAFIPNAGTFTFESKLPGDGDSGKESSSSDPHDYGVEAYNITFGGKSVSVPINATTTEVKKSGKGSFFSPYRWTFYYAYNYQEVQGSGLNTESASFEAKYEYKLKNTLRTVYIRNVKVPVGRHIRLADNGNGTTSITNVSLPATSYGGTSSTAYHINLRSFYVEGTSIKYESSNSEFHFGSGSTIANGKASITKSVQANSCAFIGGEANCASTASKLGNPDYQEVDVYFTPRSNKNGSSTATITIYDGTTARATITLTAKVIPTYYFKATSVATNGTQTLDIPVKASFTEGSYAGATQTVSQTAADADVASLTKKAYFYAPASSGDYQFQGWYTTADCSGTRVSTDNTISDDITSSAVSSATATEKKYYALYLPIIAAEFTGSDQTLKVDGAYNGIGYTRTSAATASTNSTDKFWYEIIIDSKTSVTAGSSDANKVISYDPTTKTVTAINAGTARLVFHQEATGYYVDVDKTYTFTVEKYATSISGGTQYNLEVEDAQAITNYNVSNISQNVPDSGAMDHNFYYTIAHTLPENKNVVGSTHPNEVIAYNASKHTITAYNAGSAVLTIAHKETYKYTGDTTVFNVNVSKKNNAISCSWGSWTKNLNFNKETNVVFSAKNTDVPIVVTQKTGKTIAIYHSAPQNTIRASYSVGEATWSVSQAENYKYLAPETKTVTVNVGTVPLECYVLDKPAEKSIGKYGDAEHKQYQTYSWTEEGAVLKFKMWKFSNANDIGNYVTLYDGAGAKIGNDYNYSIGSMSTSPTEYTITLPAGVRSVKFRNGTGAWEGASTLNTYISHVKVTRSTWLNLQDKEGEEIDSLEMPILLINNASTTADFYINYNTCADEIKVVSNHPHIKVSEESFESGTSGTKKITVTYSSTALENINATITVYTPSENKTLTIHAQTVKQPQTIIWSAGYEDATISLPVGLEEANPATASSGLTPVLYSTNQPSVIQIADDGQSFSVIGEGTATLTASQAGDNALWDPVSSSKTINATDKKIQVIHWEQDFTRSIAPGDVKSLLAEVYINNPLAGVQTKDDARTALIQYSCPIGNDVISVAGNQMTVLGYGTTSVTATIVGDEDYEEASVTLLVRVREPSAGCETPFVLDHTEQVQLFSMDIEWGEWTTPQITSEPILIDKSKGKPDKLSFMHEGEEYVIPVISKIKVYRGPIKVQERVNGDWSDVEGSQVTPTKYEWNQLSNLQLNENADAIRFVRLVEGQGYHNIKNIQISLLQYLREEEETINLGNIQAGAVWPSAIGFDYSDVKHDLLVSKSGADGSFLQMDETIEIDCGSHDHYDFPITFAPTHIGDWTNDVTITDPITSKSITVHLTAHVIQGSQSIVWNVAKTTYAVTEPMNVLTATATSGLPVSYTITAGNDVASIVGDEVIISKPGTFTIQASQAGDVNFKAAEPVSKTFTIAVSEYVFTNQDGNSDWNTTGNWLAGTKPGNNEDVIIRGNLIINNNVEVHSLTIEEGFEVALTVGGQLTVGDGASQYREHYGDLHVEKEGHVFLNGGELKVNKFILDATLNDIVNGQEAKSGQVTNPASLDIIETAYFDLDMDPDPDGQVTFGWYDFTVPFDVNISNGIFRLNNDGSTTPLVSGRDFIVTYYDEARRAAGQKGWVQMNGSAQLTAGVAYSITLDDEVTQNTIRFVWNKQHSIGASYSTPVTRSNNGTTTNRGWNGIGNGTLTHTQLQGLPANTKVQMYDHSTKSFRAVDAADYTYAVGTAFFYQAPENPLPVVQTKADGTLLLPLRAPQYENRTVNEFRLTLTEESTAREVDVLYVSASEEATGEYAVGHDLLKMASANEVSIAQIWATNGKLQLCDIEMPLINNNAICDLGLNAPKEGAYILEIQRAPEDAMLYLTYEGRAIWNLSYSPYVFDLTKGMTEGYGLKLYANPAPQITTGIENDEVLDGENGVRKVIIDNTMYIITSDGAMYDVTGKSVK